MEYLFIVSGSNKVLFDKRLNHYNMIKASMCMVFFICVISLHAQQIDIKAGGGLHQMKTISEHVDYVQTPGMHLTVSGAYHFPFNEHHAISIGLNGNLQSFNRYEKDIQTFSLTIPVLYNYQLAKFNFGIGLGLDAVLLYRYGEGLNNSISFSELYENPFGNSYYPIKPKLIGFVSYKILGELSIFATYEFAYCRSRIRFSDLYGHVSLDMKFHEIFHWGSIGISYCIGKGC